MCFSAQADLIAGAAVTAIGAFGLSHVQHRRDWPLAALPVILGTHLLVEVGVWRSIEGSASAEVGRLAAWVYLGIALVVVPILVPFAVMLIEPERRWRRFAPLCAVGVVVALGLAHATLGHAVGAHVTGHHITYEVSVGDGGLLVAGYLVATCLPALLSDERGVRAFGLVNVVAVAALIAVQKSALLSLWCAWAAVTSVVIVARLRAGGPTERVGRTIAKSSSQPREETERCHTAEPRTARMQLQPRTGDR